MSINIYELDRVNTNALFSMDEEVNGYLFDLVDCMKSDASNAKRKAEICYSIMTAPTFSKDGKCEKTKPEEVVEGVFGALLKKESVKKYTLVVTRFAKSENAHNIELYNTLPIGKLIILSALESPKNIENGYHCYGFMCSQGKAVNDEVKKAHDAWKEENAHKLDKIEKMRGVDDEIADMLTAQLTEEPTKPAEVNYPHAFDDCTDEERDNANREYYETLYYMGLDIVKKLSDSELKSRVSDYIPKKAKSEKSDSADSTDSTDNPEETPEEKTARLKKALATAFADYIAAAEISGEKVTETMKQVARKVGAEV